ncbi:MAG: glycosyltransferase family 2 protein [Chitinivibrionales bacterium]
MKSYFYKLLFRYISFYAPPDASGIEISPHHDLLINLFPNARMAQYCPKSGSGKNVLSSPREIGDFKPDFLVLNGNLHYENDLQSLLGQLHSVCQPHTRVIITYYSSLWRPLMRLATRLHMRHRTPEQNWISHEDIDNLLRLTDFEPVQRGHRVLCPIYIPLLSNLINRYLAPLPFFRLFTMINVLVARPLKKKRNQSAPSVSIIIPARNEAGTLEDLIRRIPAMGPDDELIFIEGHSRDDTWLILRDMERKYSPKIHIIAARQDGNGKGDAVRKGFDLASRDFLMVLDADMSVMPEDLPKFFHALIADKGEFINGSRLVYPVPGKAMRFWNIVGNRFFATMFSFLTGQRFKDTLCGTKALSRENYAKIAAHRSYFGEFDPFGDFDLIFGACRLGMKIVEIPVQYKPRTYGTTNIRRWRHGLLLFRMLLLAARKITFI